MTINQAIGPMEKGMVKIQETFHHTSDSQGEEDESQLQVEEHIEEHPTSENHV